MSIDFSNIREFTEGDPEIEIELFEEFISSSAPLLKNLEDSVSNDQDLWKKSAHAFKGISLNLGAEALGSLCMQAQNFDGEDGAKKELFEQIENEYRQVLSDLKKEIERIKAI